MKKTLITLILGLFLISCTDNQRAKSFGGTETIQLKENEEFVNITWKQDNLWVIVKNTSTNEFYAREKSSFGMLEGKVVIKKYK